MSMIRGLKNRVSKKAIRELFSQIAVASLIVALVISLSPNIHEHYQELSMTVGNSSVRFDRAESPFVPWESLGYKHMGLFSYVFDKESGEVVSVGFMHNVWVLDSDWSKEENSGSEGEKIFVFSPAREIGVIGKVYV